MGVPARWVTPDDIAELNPWVNLDGIIGGTYCPRDGWGDTSTSTAGFAQSARRNGARIIEETPVTGMRVEDGRIAGIVIGNQTISTRQVVVAAGPYTGVVGAMAGVELPVEPLRENVLGHWAV